MFYQGKYIGKKFGKLVLILQIHQTIQYHPVIDDMK